MALPAGADLKLRLSLDDQSGKLIPLLDRCAAAALEMVRGLTNLALPSTEITGECPFVSSYNTTIITDRWPVTSLQRVLWAGQPVRLGTLADLFNDRADVAIAARGDGLEVAGHILQGGDRRGLLEVDYTAGYDTLPADLLEIWSQIAMLLWHETARSGIAEDKMGDATVKFTRELPPLITGALGRYRRYPMP